MSFPARRAPEQTLKFLFFVFVAAAAAAGCTGKSSAEQELDAAFKSNPEFKRLAVAKYSGHVTIDGQEPGAETNMFVILLDPEKFKDRQTPHYDARVAPDGSFSFTTYLKDDGAPVGKHIVCFVDPRIKNALAAKKVGARSLGRPSVRETGGPDFLKNLYNDPEKNSKDPKFMVDVEAPGNTDANFNLEVNGKDPPPAPGQYAITKIITE
jgi:hypothetical protein